MKYSYRLYAIQLSPPDKYIHVNFAARAGDITHRFEELSSRRYANSPRMIKHPDLEKTFLDKESTRQAGFEFINKLSEEGYIAVDGGLLLTGNQKLYVIHINNPGSRSLYVGRTDYPIETRFLQHKIGIRSARIFNRNGNKPHSIAQDLILDKRSYGGNITAANKAERALAEKLKDLGYDVHFA